MTTLLKHPTAWFPLLMSLSAILLLAGHLAIFGIPQNPPKDEGTAAHIFQLLMAGQIPVIILFAIMWLPKKPKEAAQIIGLQFVAILLAFAPVFFLDL